MFSSELYAYFGASNVPTGRNIIKKRHDQLGEQGDLCFPLELTVWRRFIAVDPERELALLTFSDQDLIDCSKSWRMPVIRICKQETTCRIYFNRVECLWRYFEGKIKTKGGNHEEKQRIPRDLTRNTDIDTFRRSIAEASLERLMEGCTTGKEAIKSIRVGPCFDSQTKKPITLSYREYLAKRSTDMQLIAQHKYGLRVQNEAYLRDLVGKLGEAAVVVDLLEAKTSGPVFLTAKVNQLSNNTSSKGASFILYNSARIETLCRVFEERQLSGYYPADPEQIDWSLLKEEDEWKLFYNFIVEYEHVKKHTVRELQLHHLCAFLYKLVGQFSVYYRRTKVLTVGLLQLD